MYSYTDNPQYGLDRMYGSIVSFDGHPGWLEGIEFTFDEGWVAKGSILQKGRNYNTLLSCPLDKLDPTTRHLGFVNIGANAIYVSRVPRRQWKQGLRSDNLFAYGFFLDKSFFSTDGFIQSYQGVYPKIPKVLEKLDPKLGKSVAFHKEYSVTVDGNLKYRYYNIGTFSNSMTFDISLTKDFTYLEEELEEVIHAAL